MFDSLQVNLSREGRFIIADVTDGENKFRFKFGDSNSIKHINSQIPKLFADELWDLRMRAKFEAKFEAKRAV